MLFVITLNTAVRGNRRKGPSRPIFTARPPAQKGRPIGKAPIRRPMRSAQDIYCADARSLYVCRPVQMGRRFDFPRSMQMCRVAPSAVSRPWAICPPRHQRQWGGKEPIVGMRIGKPMALILALNSIGLISRYAGGYAIPPGVRTPGAFNRVSVVRQAVRTLVYGVSDSDELAAAYRRAAPWPFVRAWLDVSGVMPLLHGSGGFGWR